MPASRDPVKRQAQLANLKPTAASTHKVYSKAAIRPIRERLVAELAEAFPNATAAEIATQAMRMAQLELAGAYLDERGIVQHQRRGTIYPVAQFAASLSVQFEKQHALLMARERDLGQPSPHAALEAHLASLGNGDAS
jgi:hypothetical protein